MIKDVHERARQWIALDGKAEPLPVQEQRWLQLHLDGCQSCRRYSEAVVQVVQEVQAQPMDADFVLMRQLQATLRLQTIVLRQTRQRFRLVLFTTAFVAMSAALTTAFFWQASSWLGITAHCSTAVLQTGFALLWTTPTLVVSAVLAVRAAHLHGRGELQWR